MEFARRALGQLREGMQRLVTPRTERETANWSFFALLGTTVVVAR